MDYNSIMNLLEEQKKDVQLSTKLYRYTGLIQAIEFFSQKLNLDQIVDAAFDFVNELLTLEKSAAFILQGNSYVLKKLKGHDSETTVIRDGSGLRDLALLHGTILYERSGLEKYLDKAILDEYEVTAVVPLIVDNALYGFILVSKKAAGEMNHDDYIISEALMRLINNALENFRRYEELQKSHRELDEKVFNLFAINQSSKVLLSELNLDVLYNLSVDVFSELTQSSITGFVLYDEKSEKYVLKAFKDVLFGEPDAEVAITQEKIARVDMNKIIIDTSSEKDAAYFNSLFKEGLEAMKPLKAQYIVLLLKNGKILGMVSLGATTTGREYKRSIFELIESLASATYIALSNAQLFRQVNDQKKIIQNKLKKLTSLNSLMKNINSSLKIDTLLSLTLKTLEVSFDVEKGLIALYDQENGVFQITDLLHVETEVKVIKPNENWKKVFEGDLVFDASEAGIATYLDKSFCSDAGAGAGILIAPIYLDRVDVEILGVIILFKYGKVPIHDEENMLTVETIAGHIAPVMSNLLTIEEQKRFSLPNYIELFKRDLKNAIAETLELSSSLTVLQVNDDRDFVFRGNQLIEKLRTAYPMVYPFTNNNIFILYTGEEAQEKEIMQLAGMEKIEVRGYTLGNDFHNFQEFFKLFQ